MEEVGRPAAYVAHLQRVRLLRAAGCLVAGLVVVALNSLLPLIVVIAAVVAAGAGANRFADSAAKAARGARSERAVAAALRRTRGAQLVAHGVVWPGSHGDSDHVVVLTDKVVVVETKSGGGVVRAVGDGGLEADGRQLRGAPLRQVNGQARAAHDALGCWVHAVVCVVNMSSRPFIARGVLVCSAADLPRALEQLDRQRGDAGDRSAQVARRVRELAG